MKYLKWAGIAMGALLVAAALIITGTWLFLKYTDWGFHRQIPEAEQALRLQVVSSAERWIDVVEGSNEHAQIVQNYNNHEPLAQGYAVTIEDNWCATYASSIAITCDLTDIIPTECGCQRQIGLWQTIGRWEENDNHMPLPGDYIYYAWDEDFSFGDCTGWADHVGIVIGTAGPFIKVVEGNKDDMVTYRIILRGNWQIRGYGLPDYASKIQ